MHLAGAGQPARDSTADGSQSARDAAVFTAPPPDMLGAAVAAWGAVGEEQPTVRARKHRHGPALGDDAGDVQLASYQEARLVGFDLSPASVEAACWRTDDTSVQVLGGPASRADHLALAVVGHPALAGLASERLALNAVDVSNQADAARAAGEPRAQVLDNRAGRAAAAVRMAQDGAPAGDPGSQHRLRAVVNALGQQGAGEFARTAQAFYPQTVATVLGAVNAGPDTAAAGAFTRSAFLALHEQDYANAPGLATSMGAALGRVWNPTDPVAASRDAGRMGAIPNTPQGRSLLAQSDGVGQFLDRREELALVRRTPGITAQSLDATDDVWQALVHSTAPGRDDPKSQAAAR